ncbi:MAG TPA: hypothetical protein VN758_09310 [Solirubrobacterales bacterium]|nr:hypothetical protein [Solirubrobacterales bacterium]
MAPYWKVNSYGYPNPFSDAVNPKGATEVLDAFLAETSYSKIKDEFANGRPRNLDHSAVESWKATFEEFGILYVLTGSDEIVITPGGRQLLEARDAGEVEEFTRVGLGLLVRYPLRGQRAHRPDLKDSDLLIHRAVLAAMLDLGGEVWRPEIAYILSGATTRSELSAAVAAVASIRGGDERDILEHDPPESLESKNFYNMLNQVFVHSGMNGLLLSNTTSDARFSDPTVPGFKFTSSRRVETVLESARPMIEEALGGVDAINCVGNSGSFVDRLPAAPVLTSEGEYFEYAGAIVPKGSGDGGGPVAETYGGELVWVLKAEEHYELVGEAIVGPSSKLCAISPGQRLIVSHDLERTRLVEAKALTNDGRIELKVREARTISNPSTITGLD